MFPTQHATHSNFHFSNPHLEGLCQLGFGDGYVGTVGEERERHTDTEGLGEPFGCEGCAL